MKCKNCAGEYRAREMICPYCGTENAIGRMWQVERSQAEKMLLQQREELGKTGWTVYDVQRICNRISLCFFAVFVALMVGVIVVTIGSSIYESIDRSIHMEKYTKQLQDLAEEERWDAVSWLIYKKNLYGVKELEFYTQINLGASYYTDFEEYAGRLLEERENIDEEYQRAIENGNTHPYWLFALMDNSIEAYHCHWLADKEEYSEILGKWRTEIEGFWRGTMQLDEETIQRCMTEDISDEEIEAILDTFKERRVWETWQH